MRGLAIAFAASAALLLSHAAAAGEGCGAASVVEHMFGAADKDASGAITPDEYAAAGLDQFGVPFADYDADADGEASLLEFRALYERHHAVGNDLEI